MTRVQSARITTDIAMIGGGVAGAACAAALAGAGLSVTVIEREGSFRDRVRGEGIHPWGMREVEALGLLPVLEAAGAHELPRWTNYSNRVVRETFAWTDDAPNNRSEWSIFHPQLQRALLDHAAQAGARVLRPARVQSVQLRDTTQLTVTTEDQQLEIDARLIVGADGRKSTVRDWLGATEMADPPHHQIGGCLLAGVAADDTSSHMGTFDGGFVLLFPQGEGRARAYVICDTELAEQLRGRANIGAFIQQCSSALPEGAVSASTAHPLGPLAFFSNANTWSDRLAGDGIVLIGDAAGASDPSMGQGLSLCFRDARELRDALVSEPDWSRAVQQFAERRATYFGVVAEHARWSMLIATGSGPEVDARRALVARAREADPTAGGFASMLANGPDGLVVDEAARRHYFGEDLAG